MRGRMGMRMSLKIAPGVADTPQCSEAKRGVVAKHGKTAEESSGDALQKINLSRGKGIAIN